MTTKRADISLATTAGLIQFNGAGTLYMVQTPSNVLYYVYLDIGSDVAFRKSSDGGLTWSDPVIIFAGTATIVSIWYDRWSGIAAGLIHCVYTESVTDDTFYRSINTESSDTLGTQTTIFLGASTAAGSSLSIARARGGNLYCKTVIDAGAEGGFYRSVDVGANWVLRTVNEAIATQDMMIMLPGFAADTQDMMAFFWDASADEISRYLYDDSADTWGETSISGTMVEQNAATAFPHFAATVDLTNSRNILVAWNAIDGASADLKGWVVTESAITAFATDVVSNGTDDQGLAGIGIETSTGWWWVFYVGKSDGSENFLTSVNIYCKCSKDSGATWGPETQVTKSAWDITWLVTCPRFSGTPMVAWHKDTTIDELMLSVEITSPRTTCLIGL